MYREGRRLGNSSKINKPEGWKKREGGGGRGGGGGGGGGGSNIFENLTAGVGWRKFYLIR